MGLVALWREGLLAQKVLLGQTKGYKFHPQLARFRSCPDPVLCIGSYLSEVQIEAERRGYRFDASKISVSGDCEKINVQRGQVDFEWEHLLGKLKARSPEIYAKNKELIRPAIHPLFKVIPGSIENWERV
jgi:hypothetical protein